MQRDKYTEVLSTKGHMETFIRDIRYGIRGLLSQPGFAAIIVLTLALGIGANAAIFSVTDKLLIRSLAVKNPGQLVLINSISVSPHFVSNAFSYPTFTDYRDQNHVFSGLVAFSRTRLQLEANGHIERVPSEYVSGNYFDVLGVTAARGRTFLPEEDKTRGTQPVAVISDKFWRSHFGIEQDPIGQTLTLNKVSMTVIGIAPPPYNGMALEQPTEIWVPILMHPQLAQSKFIENRKDGWLSLLGRIKDGVTQSQAEAGMDLLAQQIKEANTSAGTMTKGMPFSEQHIKFEPGGKGISFLRKEFSTPLKLLMAVVDLVLILACANVSGLLMARGVARRKEMAVRATLGASNWRLARQLVTESLLLAALGGIGGLLLAPWLIALLVNTQARLNSARPLLTQTLDLRVVAFTSVITVLAGIAFGVVPAIRTSRNDLIPALKESSGGSSAGRFGVGPRGLLVVGQLAVAIVVLVVAGLCIKSLRNLLAIDPGYETERLLVVPVELDEKKYDEVQARVFQQQVFERLAALPGVESVSDALVPPLSDGRYLSSLMVDGNQPVPNEQMAFDANTVGPRYHETMGIQIVKGRGFTDQDQTSADVVVINEALAGRLFPGQDALGKRVRSGPGMPPLEIVGIAHDVRHHDLTETALPHFDRPHHGYGRYTNFVVRTRGRAMDLIPLVRRELLALDPSLTTNQIEPMSAAVGNALAPMRLASTLVALFGLLALVLASIGLYGVMAWMVSRRTREVGIRMALGAQAGDVLMLVIKHGMFLTISGIALGIAAAFVSTRLIKSQLYQVSTTDPLTFVVISTVLALVSLLACYIPARRATKVDPLVALRYE
jgi:predicted permease